MPASLQKIGRLWRTLRPLKCSQIAGQINTRLRGATTKLPEISDYPGSTLDPQTPWLSPHDEGNTAEKLRTGNFRFINLEKHIGFLPDWHADAPRLWQYHLHYFSWAWLLDFEETRLAALDWIEQHPATANQWEPYPVSLRLQNWIVLFFGKFKKETEADPSFRDTLWHSIEAQAHWLEQHLEWHIDGNHLLENFATLTFFESTFGRHLKADAHTRLREALREQILPDGMHYERSPMYHARVLYLLLQLAHASPEARQDIEPLLPGMVEALQCLTRPDGELMLFNDSAQNIYPSTRTLTAAAQHFLKQPESQQQADVSWTLPNAGYHGAHTAKGHAFAYKAGELGASTQPGHAHADLFSFELCLAGRPILIDSGLHDYENSLERAYVRSTEAHNTVVIEDQNQGELWGAFRLGRRPKPQDIRVQEAPEHITVSGWHNGYTHLPGSPRHARTVRFEKSGELKVVDRVTSSTSVKAEHIFHFHPSCILRKLEPDTVEVRAENQCYAFTARGQGSFSLDCQPIYPSFYQREDAPVLRFLTYGREIEVIFRLRSASGRSGGMQTA